MIMRVTWGKIRPGKWDQYEEIWKVHARETAETPGLRGRWLLREANNEDAGYGLAVWDSQQDFDAYRSRGGSRLTAEMEECFVGEYVTTVCEIRGSELSKLG